MPELDAENAKLAKAQAQANAIHEAELKAQERRLAKTYRDAFVNLEAQLGKLYASMGEPPSIEEARKYGRLQAMQDSVAAEYRKVTGKAINITDESARESFASGAYGSRWAVDQATGVEISWPVLPVDAIREAAYADVAGEDFEERYRNYQQTDKIKVQQHIAQGIAAGESYQKAARKLRDDITVSLSKAMQITRTESTRDYTLGRLHTTDELGEIGIEARKQWVATLDARTRDSHGSLDGELADEDGEWSIHGMTTAGPGLFGDPAEDINCRCSYIDVIAGFEPEFRRIRDEEIVPYVKYTDWAEAKGWTADKGWPKAKEAKE